MQTDKHANRPTDKLTKGTAVRTNKCVNGKTDKQTNGETCTRENEKKHIYIYIYSYLVSGEYKCRDAVCMTEYVLSCGVQMSMCITHGLMYNER